MHDGQQLRIALIASEVMPSVTAAAKAGSFPNEIAPPKRLYTLRITRGVASGIQPSNSTNQAIDAI
jgi:hypothetical protein